MDEQQQTGPKQSDIAEKAADRRKPLYDPTGRVEQLTAGETLVADIRRHPFGLFLIYFEVFLAIALATILLAAFIPTIGDILGISNSNAGGLVVAFIMFILIFALIFVVLATRIYKGNQLIVSDKNVTQVLQIGLFDRKVSELSMANIEDVTAQQKGILPTAFNYGTLKIETAGEQNNFIFVYAPNPNAVAKAILDARLDFLNKKSGPISVPGANPATSASGQPGSTQS